MAGSLVVVTGVGTEVGKTHLACTLLVIARSAGLRAAGYKPVESGIATAPTDQERLDAESFHVKPPLAPRPRIALRDPVSPHLAARRAGVTVDLQAPIAWASAARETLDVLIVELPGGLFSPLSDTERNVDLVPRLHPTHTLLVASDALGVLHDIEAVRRAAPGLPISTLVLVEPPHLDASTGTNAPELLRLGHAGHIASFGRGPAAELAGSPAGQALRRHLGW